MEMEFLLPCCACGVHQIGVVALGDQRESNIHEVAGYHTTAILVSA